MRLAQPAGQADSDVARALHRGRYRHSRGRPDFLGRLRDSLRARSADAVHSPVPERRHARCFSV